MSRSILCDRKASHPGRTLTFQSGQISTEFYDCIAILAELKMADYFFVTSKYKRGTEIL